jgi:hypothetical protein
MGNLFSENSLPENLKTKEIVKAMETLNHFSKGKNRKNRDVYDFMRFCSSNQCPKTM